MRKETFIRITAMVVLIWYSICIIGFDVHTCKNIETSFLVSVVGDFGNCDSIHPDVSCNPDEKDHCHEISDVPSHSFEWTTASCCSDEFQSLDTISPNVQRVSEKHQDIQMVHHLDIASASIPFLLDGFGWKNRISFTPPVQVGGEALFSRYSVFRI